MPEKRTAPAVVGVETLGRVHDHFGAEGAFDHQRCAVRRPALTAVRLPPILAGRLVNCEQIRAGRLIAEQDQEIAMQYRRAAVPPLNVERAVLFREVSLPNDYTAAIERDD